jgi:hypothetical protein
LGAPHAGRSAGEAFFFGDGEEGLKLVKVHGGAANASVVIDYELYLCKCKELQICFMVAALPN